MSELQDRNWDAIVIGTGVGGGTVGRRLAERGMSVLFVEKGPMGQRSEETGLSLTLADPIARTVRGFWPDPVRANLDGDEREFFAYLGACVGGTSVFYAATLERPEPHDLDHTPDRPHPTGGWSVGWGQMLPYFDEAQRLFWVSGEPDPLSDFPSPELRPPPMPGPGEQTIMAGLRGNGLHPYVAHSAIRRIPGCRDCIGGKCPLPCKMDGRSAGVEPALATGRAELLDLCEAVRLQGSGRRITHLHLRRNGEAFTLRADRIILAAGALSSPRLLLDSRSEEWVAGCANGSGMVGRNLMFHLNEMFAIWPGRSSGKIAPSKSIGLRDLYYLDGVRYGMIQALGAEASYGDILHVLRQRLDRSRLRAIPGARDFLRIPAAVAASILGRAKLFVGLLEDFPYPENRVTTDPSRPHRIHIEYRLMPELLERRQQFRRMIRESFKGQHPMFLFHEPQLNFGHPCGTLRMGTDPQTSVLNSECRAHDIDNLWVADASFMPTSMGVNPSLTIAANALRVADRIVEGT